MRSDESRRGATGPSGEQGEHSMRGAAIRNSKVLAIAVAMLGASAGPLAGQPKTAAPPANGTGPFTPPAGTKIESVIVAPVEQGSQFGVSPHGVHVATLSHSGSRAVMIYDGVPGPKFDQIFGQGATGVLGVIFSPDGKRYGYCGRLGSEFIVMADGKEVARSAETDQGGLITANSCMIGFTPGSKHVYYISLVRVGNSASVAARFVYDGQASPPGASAGMRDFAFSPDRSEEH